MSLDIELLSWLAVVSFGATIFALIVGLFSAYNGRQIRSYIGDLIRKTFTRTQELKKRHHLGLPGLAAGRRESYAAWGWRRWRGFVRVECLGNTVRWVVAAVRIWLIRAFMLNPSSSAHSRREARISGRRRT